MLKGLKEETNMKAYRDPSVHKNDHPFLLHIVEQRTAWIGTKYKFHITVRNTIVKRHFKSNNDIK
jgi:hypothetical protein